MSSDLFKKGLKIRREIVGDDRVDKWIGETDEYLEALEEVTTEIAWGSIWSRPGLTKQTRSLLTLVLLAAQNRPVELEAHLLTAVRNGGTAEEIREALLHTAAYCGVPTARGAIKLATKVLA
jgi:alkylhydroperoxidase/carboxymuconolactone decarboxylase family protein YurZ